jgi:hypothetical protein
MFHLIVEVQSIVLSTLFSEGCGWKTVARWSANVPAFSMFVRVHVPSSKPTHITFTTRRATSPGVHIYNEQLPQAEKVKYLGLHLDIRLTWHKHIFAKRKHLGITPSKMYWLLGRKSKLSIINKLLVYKVIFKHI